MAKTKKKEYFQNVKDPGATTPEEMFGKRPKPSFFKEKTEDSSEEIQAILEKMDLLPEKLVQEVKKYLAKQEKAEKNCPQYKLGNKTVHVETVQNTLFIGHLREGAADITPKGIEQMKQKYKDPIALTFNTKESIQKFAEVMKSLTTRG